jgi:ATPase
MNNQPKSKDETYLVDTSAIIHKKVSKLLKHNQIKGTILVPNAAIAELENLANRGQDVGFKGLEEIAKLHKFKSLKIKFVGPRPSEHHIKYAKSGEIDALIRSLASTYHATLITADIVQSKSAAAYGIKVLFHKVRFIKPKKRKFLFFKK